MELGISAFLIFWITESWRHRNLKLLAVGLMMSAGAIGVSFALL